MAPRSAADYRQSLDDDRTVYQDGSLVSDVVGHPTLSKSVAHAAAEFDLQFQRPDLFLVDTDTMRYSRYFDRPESASDLYRRRELVRTSTRESEGLFNCIRAIGADALMALLQVTPDVDKRNGTEYYTRVSTFLETVRDQDLGVVVAMTDVKGDRSKPPSEQVDPDHYLHVVEQRSDGIVVRGAKAHTSHGPIGNEVIVLPTSGMGPDEEAYALSFAIPADSEGLTFVSRPGLGASQSAHSRWISGQRDEVESLTIFDDVFVPNRRVFLNGEAESAGEIVEAFATFHRFTALSYKPELIDLFIGAAELVADANGLDGAPAIRRKVTEMIEYVETVRGLATAAAYQCEVKNGVARPDPTICAVGKSFFARNYHRMERHLQDIAGGLVVTIPSEADRGESPVGRLVSKYLAGNHEWSSRDRQALFSLIRELTASEFAGWQEVLTLHGEGSIEAQRIAAYSSYDRAGSRARVESLVDLSEDYLS